MEEKDKEGIENLNKDSNEWSSNQIKIKKIQLIFFYLKTAKKGMLNILNQCQDRSYVAYCTFYAPPKTQTSTSKDKFENNEEEISNDDDFKNFVDSQPEATLFYLETPSNARELAEDIARLALNHFKTKLNEKGTSLKYKTCFLKCSFKEHPHGSLRYCPNLIQKTPKETKDLIAKMNICNYCLTPGHITNRCPLKKFGCATCYRYGEDLTIVKTHLSWNCNRHPGLVELHATTLELKKNDDHSKGVKNYHRSRGP